MRQDYKTSIRESRSTDALQIAGLLEELGYPATPQQTRNRLLRIEHDPTFRTFVAAYDGAIVGMIGVRIGTSYQMDALLAQILLIIVSGKFRRKGIGQLLLDTAQKWAVKQGAGKIITISEAHQTEAHYFFHGQLFQPMGYHFTKEFTPPPSERMLVNSKSLSNPVVPTQK